MDETIYQRILDELAQYLPQDWQKLVVYLEYGEASYTIAFFVKQSGKYRKCYDLAGVSDAELLTSFKCINEFVAPARKNAPGGKWTTMTMVVDDTGDMHTDFSYEDLSETSYEYEQEWKKQYLV